MYSSTTHLSNVAALDAYSGDSLDINEAQIFRDRIASIIDNHQNVLIDMSSLHFVDSTGPL